MGRIITFAAPKYYATSRASSPEHCAEDIAPEAISVPRYDRLCSVESSSSSYSQRSTKTKSVTFSELPPLICEIPYWDRSPLIPSPEELEKAQDDSEGDTDDDLPAISSLAVGRRHSSATSLEQATRWARRLSV